MHTWIQITIGLALLTGGKTALAQVCAGTEPPASACDIARVIPGTPGHHVVMMDVSTATGTSTICNGIFSTHNVWFEVTPTVSGPMTITTCHPMTQYDTVIQVYRGGDANCDFMVTDTCNDDDVNGEGCTGICGPRSSHVLVQATAGTRYRFVVGSFGAINAPCQPCLGVRVTIGATCGEPPDNFDASLAVEIPGTPGTFTAEVDVTDAVKLPSEPNPSCVGPDIGNSVWYSVTPEEDGWLTVSTCTPSTNFDTVAAIYLDAGGGVLVEEACDDDDPNAVCINACDPGAIGSRASAPVDAGSTYLIQVGSYNDNGFPHTCATPLCLGVEVRLESFCDTFPGAPAAALTAPTDLSCGCLSVQVFGTAEDSNGIFDRYDLEYRALGATTWNAIATGASEVQSGLLAVWSTSGLAQGYYVLRLTATNVCGRTATAERVVFVDTFFDNLDFRSPPHGAVVGGSVCLDGSALDSFCFDNYTADYSPVGGTLVPVDPLIPVYATPVANDPLASWDTIALGLPDGDYELYVEGTTVCGNGAGTGIVVTVDNTPPVTFISSPVDCQAIDGAVQVIGTVDDANLGSWSLSFTGGGLNEWVPLNGGVTPVFNGVLHNWDVSGLPPCSYTLRLAASDEAALDCNGVVHNTSEFLISVDILDPDCPDVTGDGLINISDLGLILSTFGTTCP